MIKRKYHTDRYMFRFEPGMARMWETRPKNYYHNSAYEIYDKLDSRDEIICKDLNRLHNTFEFSGY